ncbi:hypothetical protein RND71_017332 [Anisodus tanguticus]|uniref:Zinc finger PHD-type domain-containing protein n=1 Tax=Anisodus tanguticus TaxID=243964 RepID=A0AAE1S3X9_9SOLA|nr:hypothetical protein RND71_017332 [Anisodus tanguticus]
MAKAFACYARKHHHKKKVTCIACVAPWHMDCPENPPVTLTSVVNFKCPDCAGTGFGGAPAPPPVSAGGELVAKVREIEADTSMTEEEKDIKRRDRQWKTNSRLMRLKKKKMCWLCLVKASNAPFA